MNDRSTHSHRQRRRPLVAAGLLIGAGMGGFVDGIVLHQMLQWHNMVSGWLPPTNLVDAKINMFWDGVFHAAVWSMTVLGLLLLWRASRDPTARWSGRLLAGGSIAGWGVFNTVEGVVNHLILGIHHVHESSPDPAVWDWAFQASGLLLLATGALVIRSDHGRDERDPARTRVTPPPTR